MNAKINNTEYNIKDYDYTSKNERGYRAFIKRVKVDNGELVNTDIGYQYYLNESLVDAIPVARNVGVLYKPNGDDYSVVANGNRYEFAREGFYRKVAANVPRFDWTNGKQELLVEGQADNNIYKNIIDWQFQNNVTITSDTTTNLIGEIADLILADNITSNQIFIREAFSFFQGENTFSFFLNPYNTDVVGVRVLNLGILQNIELVNRQNNPSNVNVIDYNNNWMRVSITFIQQTFVNSSIYIYPLGTGDRIGNGSNGIYICLPQLEEGTEATSPILTNGSIVTRPADVITDELGNQLPIGRYPLIGDSPIFDYVKRIIADEGTIVNGELLKEVNPNTPVGRKEGKLYAYNEDDYTVIRNGGAWEFTMDGVFREVGIDVPRFDWANGKQELLVEGQSTNLFTYSWDYTKDWIIGAGGIEVQFTQKQGSFLHTPYYECNGVGIGRIQYLTNLIQGKKYTFYIFYRNTTSTVSLYDFNGTNQSITGSNPSNDWKILSYTFTAVNSSGQVQIRINSGGKAEITAAQLEEGTQESSPIITNGSIVTRPADVITDELGNQLPIGRYPLIGDSPIFDYVKRIIADEGTIVNGELLKEVNPNTPVGRKEGKLYAYNEDDYTVIRNGGAWEFTRDGVYKEVGIDVPRFDWANGRQELLVEGQSTNLVTYSNFKTGEGQAFTSSVYVDDSANFGIGFKSNLVMEYNPVENTAFYWVDVEAGKEYTISVFAKRSDGDELFKNGNIDFRLRLGGGFIGSSDYQKEQITNDIWRIWYTGVAPNNDKCGFFRKPDYSNVDIYLSGFQIGEGTGISSPIITNGSIVTRPADIITNSQGQLAPGRYDTV